MSPDPDPGNGRRDGDAHAEIVRLLRWPVVGALAIAATVVVVVLVLERVERWGRAAASAPGAVAAAAERLARGLRSGHVTQSFLATLPRLEPAGTGRLEVAVAHATETLRRTDERRALFDLVDLGTTTAEIRVPVTYRYTVAFGEPWTISIAGGVCVVEAPAIRPSLPPAIHTQGMEKRVESDWLRFDAEAQLASLERELTPTLSRFAADRRHRDLVRDRARSTVATFVERWLLSEGAWGEGGVRAVVVHFADDPKPAAPQVERSEEGRR